MSLTVPGGSLMGSCNRTRSSTVNPKHQIHTCPSITLPPISIDLSISSIYPSYLTKTPLLFPLSLLIYTPPLYSSPPITILSILYPSYPNITLYVISNRPSTCRYPYLSISIQIFSLSPLRSFVLRNLSCMLILLRISTSYLYSYPLSLRR